MMKNLKFIGLFLVRIIVFTYLIALIGFSVVIYPILPPVNENKRDRVLQIYEKVWAQTGQTQDRLPLRIIEDDTVDVYNNGEEIVLYTGLIDSVEFEDEIALVIGHEIAHGNLYHLKMLNDINWPHDDYTSAVLEAHADKMGAVYMMKAGFDVCKGRELFKHWLIEKGDYLGGSHPNYAYRYSELNINCE